MNDEHLIRVAAAQYDISYFADEQAFADKLTHWVETATQAGAELLLFPEYAAMELCSLLEPAVQADLHAQLEGMQVLLPLYLDTYRKLAMQHGVTLVAGSFPVKTTVAGRTVFVNRAHVLHPDGRMDYQDKQIMTRFENEEWNISPGEGLRVIDTAMGRVGICICYDSEFPLLGRRLIEQGADILLVPSVTETLTGYHRVRIGSQARALENQCYVVHAPLVGKAEWSPAVDINTGRAGIYTPVDQGFPDNGILEQGELNQPGWIVADLDLEKMRAIRTAGHVLNHRDWACQHERIQ